MSLDHYQRIMDSVTLSVHRGAEIEGRQAYYSACDPPRCKRIAGPDLPFQGAMNRCRCIDCTSILDGGRQAVDGLHGQRIAFAAGRLPTQNVYRRSRNHRGPRGLLRKGFWCRIDIPLTAT